MNTAMVAVVTVGSLFMSLSASGQMLETAQLQEAVMAALNETIHAVKDGFQVNLTEVQRLLRPLLVPPIDLEQEFKQMKDKANVKNSSNKGGGEGVGYNVSLVVYTTLFVQFLYWFLL